MKLRHPIQVLHACLFSIAALAATCSYAQSAFTSKELAEHVYLVQGPSGNTLVAADSDGLILIEGVPAALAADYLKYVREISGEQKVKALVNTHWHDESAGLNAAAIKAGAKVIAHANTKQWLGATIRERGEKIVHTPVAERALPTEVFYADYSVPFRSGSIELGYMLQAHTDGDIYAYFPQQDILFTGPALMSDNWNAVDETTNGFIGGLLDALVMLGNVAHENTVIVPASGPVLNKVQFTELAGMYRSLMDEMVALLRQSRSAEEVVIANPAIGLMPQWGSADSFLDEGFRSFYGHLRETRHVGIMP